MPRESTNDDQILPTPFFVFPKLDLLTYYLGRQPRGHAHQADGVHKTGALLQSRCHPADQARKKRCPRISHPPGSQPKGRAHRADGVHKAGALPQNLAPTRRGEGKALSQNLAPTRRREGKTRALLQSRSHPGGSREVTRTRLMAYKRPAR